MSRGIVLSLAPTATSRDALAALGLLFQPSRWVRGSAQEALRSAVEHRFGGEVILFSSGRWALALALGSLGAAPGDDVLIQAYTCVSVPGPVLWAGLRPVYVDINPNTLTMDPADLERTITPRSRAIVLQHTFGVPADMDALLGIARKHNLTVIEDCAHTIGATFRGQPVGTFGDATVLSFGRDKAVSSVFGGALVVRSPARFPALDAARRVLADAPAAWIVQQLLHPVLTVALIRPLYFVLGIGKVLLVSSQRLGILSKALESGEQRGHPPSRGPLVLPNALAALARLQLERIEAMNARRRALARVYADAFRDLDVTWHREEKNDGAVPLRWTLFTSSASELRRRARKYRLVLGDWYDTVIAPRGTDLRSVGYTPGSCPIAERRAQESVNLPMTSSMTTEDASRVAGIVRELLTGEGKRV